VATIVVVVVDVVVVTAADAVVIAADAAAVVVLLCRQSTAAWFHISVRYFYSTSWSGYWLLIFDILLCFVHEHLQRQPLLSLCLAFMKESVGLISRFDILCFLFW
jgi:hypothetical protein